MEREVSRLFIKAKANYESQEVIVKDKLLRKSLDGSDLTPQCNSSSPTNERSNFLRYFPIYVYIYMFIASVPIFFVFTRSLLQISSCIE